jgi:hypothetical protein
LLSSFRQLLRIVCGCPGSMYYSIVSNPPIKELRRNIHSLSWFWDHHQRGLLNLEPSYQRRSVWNQDDKDYFIDTVLNNYPASAIFLCQTISDEGYSKLSIVDGKQRLSTLFEFINGEFPIYEKATIESLRGKYFQDLDTDIKQKFWKYQFAVEYLPENESIINLIFDRINRNTIKLTSQELRHAKFNGEFITTVEELTDWMFNELGNNFPAIDKRSKKQMKDNEMVAQLLLLLEEGVRAYSQDYLDKAFSDRDINWEEKSEIDNEFRSTIQIIKQIIDSSSNLNLTKTRLKNQADFYSFFGAIAELKQEGKLPQNYTTIAQNIHTFLTEVDHTGKELETQSIASLTKCQINTLNYYKAVKNNVIVQRKCNSY